MTNGTTFACAQYYSYYIVTYAGGSDLTLRVYPLEQAAACFTADLATNVVRVQTCTVDTATGQIQSAQKWVLSGTLIQSVANPGLNIRANGGGQDLTLVPAVNATEWTAYQTPGGVCLRDRGGKPILRFIDMIGSAFLVVEPTDHCQYTAQMDWSLRSYLAPAFPAYLETDIHI